MKKKNKFYATPSTAVVELKSKGILCQSLGDPSDYLPGGGDPFNPVTP